MLLFNGTETVFFIFVFCIFQQSPSRFFLPMNTELVRRAFNEAVKHASERIKDYKVKSPTVYREMVYEQFNKSLLSEGLSSEDIEKAWDDEYVQGELTPFF